MSTSKAASKQPSTRKKPIKSSQDLEIEKMLVSGEEVILRADLHGAIYWKSIAVIIFAIVIGVFVAKILGILFGIFGAIMLCINILTRHYLLLAVTNKRILARYGLLQMDVVDIRLSKIESIDLERMLPGHMFGYANVVVAGVGQRVIRVPYIANAEAFRRYFNEMILADEGNNSAVKDISEIKENVELKATDVKIPASRKAPAKKRKSTK